ncbi:MAG: MjaI family restriction endonuclease [Clostridiaceae bacterium]|nr:MjaI family restriction endonuclease [Clostridiaceae bacterium]
MIYTLNNESIKKYNESSEYSFPKYTSQLINWANQNAQGTRPAVVGQIRNCFLNS